MDTNGSDNTSSGACPPAGASSDRRVMVQVGELEATLLSATYWRDWMPEVEKPGPDGGSPLHGNIRLRLDNATGEAIRLSFSVTVCDEANQSHSVTFHTEAVVESESRECAISMGELKTIELVTRNGPYLPVGSKLSTVVKLKSDKDRVGAVFIPESEIRRAD